jgi:integrase
MIKTTIIYNHRGRYAKDGTAPVEVRLTVSRRVYYFHTGVCVRAREWRLGQIVNRQDSDVLNERVMIMLERVGELVNDAMRNGCDIDIESIRRQVNRPKTKNVEAGEDMVAWMAEQVPMLGVRKGTMLHYKVSVAVLAESGIMRKWSDLSVENVHRWDAYLHGIQKHRTDAEVKAGKPVEYISQATVRNYHKDIKALLGRALKFGLIATNPYDRMKGEIKRGNTETVEFLTKDELARIEGLTLIDGSMLAAARDMFVFQAYTGMAFSDMQAFSLDKCRRDGDRWLMAGQRVKTGVTYYVRLLPQVLAVVEKYGGELPKVAVQTYNKNLKKIAEATGITKRLTSHVGRHTFATWALHEGVPIERVSKMLGHAKVTQTQRYAKVLAEDVFGEFDKLGGPQ